MGFLRKIFFGSVPLAMKCGLLFSSAPPTFYHDFRHACSHLYRFNSFPIIHIFPGSRGKRLVLEPIGHRHGDVGVD